MHKYTTNIILLFFVFVLNSFSQIDQIPTQKYKVVGIDSTKNNYFIFLSPDLWRTDSTTNVPSLSKDDYCYRLSQYNQDTVYCLISSKINGLSKNIYVNAIYELSLNCFTNYSREACEYIGNGEFLFKWPRDRSYSAKEIGGLFYTQDNDSINYFYQHDMFYDSMDAIRLWLVHPPKPQYRIRKSGKMPKSYRRWLALPRFSYSQWQEKLINEAQDIYLDCNDSIILYDYNYLEDCIDEIKTTIICRDYCENGKLSAQLFYTHKENGFIRIENGLHSVFGWVKNVKKYCN